VGGDIQQASVSLMPAHTAHKSGDGERCRSRRAQTDQWCVTRSVLKGMCVAGAYAVFGRRRCVCVCPLWDREQGRPLRRRLNTRKTDTHAVICSAQQGRTEAMAETLLIYHYKPLPLVSACSDVGWFWLLAPQASDNPQTSSKFDHATP
jgi:hypothetical protein